MAAYFLFHSCDLDTLRWALSTLRPWRPAGAYDERPGPAPDVPSTYVLPRQDRTLSPAWVPARGVRRTGRHDPDRGQWFEVIGCPPSNTISRSPSGAASRTASGTSRTIIGHS